MTIKMTENLQNQQNPQISVGAHVKRSSSHEKKTKTFILTNEYQILMCNLASVRVHATHIVE